MSIHAQLGENNRSSVSRLPRFAFYLCNYEGPHQSLGHYVPPDVHFADKVPIL